MKTGRLRWTSLVLLATMGLNFSGCGYLLHPERRGQRDGRIDAKIAILDGLGLLLFVVPGVVAFIVDFSTGCIYHPGGRRGSLDLNDMKEVRFDPRGATPAMIERILLRETGLEIRLDGGTVRSIELDSLEDAPRRLVLLNLGARSALLAAAR